MPDTRRREPADLIAVARAGVASPDLLARRRTAGPGDVPCTAIICAGGALGCTDGAALFAAR